MAYTYTYKYTNTNTNTNTNSKGNRARRGWQGHGPFQAARCCVKTPLLGRPPSVAPRRALALSSTMFAFFPLELVSVFMARRLGGYWVSCREMGLSLCGVGASAEAGEDAVLKKKNSDGARRMPISRAIAGP